MSVCNPCIQAKVLPNCVQVLSVGTVSLLLSNVNVYIQDITTGQIIILSTTTGAAGEVDIDISGKHFFDNHSYELWITDAGADFKDKLGITIGGTVKDTVCLSFEGVVSITGEAEVFVNQTIVEA